MNRDILVLDRASKDIEHIFTWLHARTHQGANAWYAALYAQFALIAENPERCSTIPEATVRWRRKIHEGIFKTPFGRRYRIVFEWNDLAITVLRVRGPGQRPLRLKDIPRSNDLK